MKILITDGLSSDGIKILSDAGYELDQKKLTPEELVRQICEYDCIIVRSATRVTRKVIEAGKKLKVIARGGVGVDNIDVDAAKQCGIPVVNTPGASSISVAELALGHIFAISRFLNVSTMDMRQGKWPKKEYSEGIELYKKTLGIVGLGSIGKEVARRALSLGMQVLAYDPMLSPMDFFVEITTKDRLLRNSDIITLHLPFDPSRGPTIGREEIDQMKKGVIIVNCARGGVVDETALLEGLQSGKVLGAGLDVFTDEPPTEAQRAIINHPRVSVSPHIGGQTLEAQSRIGTEIALKVVKILSPQKM